LKLPAGGFQLEAALKQEPDLTIELIKGDRGVFDVRLDGSMLFSKKIEGRFPTAADIRERLRAGKK
jgi:selT/selW/selH-like putative selenoprotein